MRILQILLVILFCATPLYAEQAHILTEIEKIQENIWYLKKDLAAQKKLAGEHQKQLGLLTAKFEAGQLERKELISRIDVIITAQQVSTAQTESDLKKLSETLSSLDQTIEQLKGIVSGQKEKQAALEKSFNALSNEYASKQTKTEQALAETGRQLNETRKEFEALSKDVGGQNEQFGLLAAGAVLILAVGLTIGLALRKEKRVSR